MPESDATNCGDHEVPEGLREYEAAAGDGDYRRPVCDQRSRIVKQAPRPR